jgi:acetoin utilization deacetylase AcuC-like enzyme
VKKNSPVAFVFHEDCLEHSNGPGHPERPERIAAIRDHLAARGLLDRLLVLRPDPCPIERIARVHGRDYIASIRRACERAPMRLDADTAVSSGSWEAALLSAGGALGACDAVVAGKAAAAFVCTRPPGHHAEADRAMGFCLFNNVAVAARYLQDEHGLGRVLIVDWDVHHGNGTQHMFEDDDSVFYFSTHQYPFYPGTGSARETGTGRGAGYTLNYPMLAGSGDEEYIQVFREVLRPEIDRVQPEAILISAGFDAHRADPLAGMSLTEKGYGAMTAILKEAADRHCGGRIVSLLEGGYDLEALGASVEAHLRALGAFSEPARSGRGS